MNRLAFGAGRPWATLLVFLLWVTLASPEVRAEPCICARSFFLTQADMDFPLEASQAQLFGAVLAGSSVANSALVFPSEVQLPLVRLSRETRDPRNDGSNCVDDRWSRRNRTDPPTCGGGGAGLVWSSDQALGLHVTPEQERLIGCGPKIGTQCDDSGIDLAKADMRALTQSFVPTRRFRTDELVIPQPGTETRRSPCARGKKNLVPRGCRGPREALYQEKYDGDPRGIATVLLPASDPERRLVPLGSSVHPLSGQSFRSELAALSWNLMMLLVSQSPEYDPARAWVADECSFITPRLCSFVREFPDLDVPCTARGTWAGRELLVLGDAVSQLDKIRRSVVFGLNRFAIEDEDVIQPAGYVRSFTRQGRKQRLRAEPADEAALAVQISDRLAELGRPGETVTILTFKGTLRVGSQGRLADLDLDVLFRSESAAGEELGSYKLRLSGLTR